ncbi:MAG: metallophosphoesterase family protein, partial [Candidatus Kariarchaeaceae archaeon]
MMSKLVDTLQDATDKLRKQPLVRTFSGNSLFVGDIHGDLGSLDWVLAYREKHDIKNLILLGDYVDRGPQQVEVVNSICDLITNDNHITPLRGNHEDSKICARYGFTEKLQNHKLSPEPFFNFFTHLPLAAMSDKIFAVHGGVPIDTESKKEDIESLPREHHIREDLSMQLLWNDPIFNKNEWKKRYRDSFRGYDCYEFGLPVTKEFMFYNKLKLVVRAHTYLPSGYQWAHDKKILSLFTSKGGPYHRVR